VAQPRKSDGWLEDSQTRAFNLETRSALDLARRMLRLVCVSGARLRLCICICMYTYAYMPHDTYGSEAVRSGLNAIPRVSSAARNPS
jgi:hypothetical protein